MAANLEAVVENVTEDWVQQVQQEQAVGCALEARDSANASAAKKPSLASTA